jgi:hypothetical protein
VDLSKPQATAASAKVYGMVVRLGAVKRARHGPAIARGFLAGKKRRQPD